jgi:hypothetical protein
MQISKPSWLLKKGRNGYTNRNIKGRGDCNGNYSNNGISIDTPQYLSVKNLTYGYKSHKPINDSLILQIPQEDLVVID